ncbi:hypothetical protein BOX15_Mlig029829g1, partial [Macrostomum lignano]
ATKTTAFNAKRRQSAKPAKPSPMSSSRKSKAQEKPFYEAPESRPTSAQIIEETRTWLREVKTKRPFTPRDGERSLFASRQVSADFSEIGAGVAAPVGRPPSAVSLGGRQFESESRPVSGSAVATRLSPIRAGSAGSGSGSGAEASGGLPPKPPSAERRRPRGSASEQQRSSQQPHRSSAGSRVQRNGSVGELPAEDSAAGDPGRRRDSAPQPPAMSEDAETEWFNKTLAPAVDLLSVAEQTPESADNTLELVRHLHSELQAAGMLGRNCRRHRSRILRAVFRLLDWPQPRLQLALAGLCLDMRVSAGNLACVAKLLFRVAKLEANDALFLAQPGLLAGISDTLAGADPAASHEALVYLAGALKFLTGGAAGVSRELLRSGCFEALTTCLGRAVEWNRQTGGRAAESLAHVLVQVLGSLRNLAEQPGTRQQFVATPACLAGVCAAMQQYPADYELQLNASRLLSKLSQHADVCAALCSNDDGGGGVGSSGQSALLPSAARELLARHRSREDLVLRLAFVLGNLAGRAEEARTAMFPDKPALDSVLAVLKFYQQESEAAAAAAASGEASQPAPRRDPGKVRDCLVKLVRLLANAAISAEVGRMCAGSRTCLRLLVTFVESKSIADNRELVSNSVAAINNLTYYMSTELASDMPERMLRVAQALSLLIQRADTDLLVEAIRPFGNLSREKAVRDWIVTSRIDEVLITLLDSSHEAVYSAAGILLNLVADPDKRQVLKKDGGVEKLISALTDLGQSDWQLACVICQALWNFTEGMTSCADSFGSEQTAQELISCLELFTDEEAVEESNRLAAGSDEDTFRHLQDVWESDFAYIGTHLLKRLRRHQSQFEPL